MKMINNIVAILFGIGIATSMLSVNADAQTQPADGVSAPVSGIPTKDKKPTRPHDFLLSISGPLPVVGVYGEIPLDKGILSSDGMPLILDETSISHYNAVVDPGSSLSIANLANDPNTLFQAKSIATGLKISFKVISHSGSKYVIHTNITDTHLMYSTKNDVDFGIPQTTNSSFDFIYDMNENSPSIIMTTIKDVGKIVIQNPPYTHR